MNIYNEIDPYAAQWLRNLCDRDLIAPGKVDERSIRDLTPDDVAGPGQRHFFAGIGGWSLALRMAGWPDDLDVWTGSCPCQTHSSAARGRHVERDWWPELYRLIVSIRPRFVFGEQVASAKTWIAGVRNDMEAIGYRFGGGSLPACAIGADHARERLYFVCYTNGEGESVRAKYAQVARVRRCGGHDGHMEPADGVPNRVAVLRAFGNAIVPQVAAEFIGAVMDTMSIDRAAV